jgi:TRAP-type uncharacterized transport system fused permease subunit
MTESSIDLASQKKLDELIRQEEGEANDYRGWLTIFLTFCAVGMSIFHLYAAYEIVPTQFLRTIHLAIVLFLVFLTFPLTARFKNILMWWDLIIACFSIFVAYYILSGGDDFTDRNTEPLPLDIAIGIGLILMILEGLRRTNGMILVTVTILFILYALFGNYLPAPWTHKGYDIGRFVGFMYMTLEGI